MAKWVSLVLPILVLSAGYSSALSSPHVVVIMMENHEYSSIIGSTQAPYINKLANQYSLATNFYAQHHPSLPNYLELVAGSNMGVSNDSETYLFSGEFIGRQLSEAGFSNGIFAESMPKSERNQTPCTFPSASPYFKRHEPYAFWDWIQGVDGQAPHCSLVHTFKGFHPDRLKHVSFLIPNICEDMHDCPISTGDQWLSANVPPILKNMHGNDFVLLLWDEGTTNNFGGGHVVAVAAGPGAKKNFKDPTFYTHRSVLRTIENLYGLGCLRNSCSATAMTNMLE